MHTARSALLTASLIASLSCGGDDRPRQAVEGPPRRGTAVPAESITEVIDWEQSAAICIGIERFRGVPAPANVSYAADDATDLAYLFAKELPVLIPPRQILVILAGRPHKRASTTHLRELQEQAKVVIDGEDDLLAAGRVEELIREQAKKIGPHGVLVLSIATHGFTTAGEHVLLMPDASTTDGRGLALNTIMQSIAGVQRLLLFVDACRVPFDPAVPAGRTAMPKGLFENLEFRGDYAIFAASEPGGYAQSLAHLENGVFTWAVIDALRGRTPRGTDEYVTPSALQTHLDRQVRALTAQSQRPEGRFSGLAELPLFPAGDLTPVARIESPRAGDKVKPDDEVHVRLLAPDLYTTVVVCPVTPNGCYAHRGSAIGSRTGETVTVSVPFGDEGTFRVFVAVTSDPKFLRGEKHFTEFPIDRRAERIVRWLGPVEVSVKEES